MRWTITRETAHEPDEDHKLPWSTWEPVEGVYDDEDGSKPIGDELARLQAEQGVCFGASAVT